MLQQCSHPNVVRYLGSYQGEEYLWVLLVSIARRIIIVGCLEFSINNFVIWQIVMEYCGGGSVADLMNVTEEPLEEYQIAYICREALKVSITLISLKMNIEILSNVVSYIFLPAFLSLIICRALLICTQFSKSIEISRVVISC